MIRLRVTMMAFVGALLIGSCGTEASTCDELREPADAQSFAHVIDPGLVSYDTNPPTSGPHMAVPPPMGVLDAPLIGPLQVRVLESGAALIQWEGVAAGTIAELERMAGPGVVVAPGSDLPAAIVATAWTWKLTCDELDVARLTDFVGARTADAPGVD